MVESQDLLWIHAGRAANQGLGDRPGSGIKFSPSELQIITKRRLFPQCLRQLCGSDELYANDGTLGREVGFSDADTIVPLCGVNRAFCIARRTWLRVDFIRLHGINESRAIVVTADFLAKEDRLLDWINTVDRVLAGWATPLFLIVKVS